MRHVRPEVFGPIAGPALNWDETMRYLEEVGGESWADRMPADAAEGEVLVELGGRLCYRSWEPGLNANVKKVREDSKEYLGNILKSGHGSVLEHANYSFIFHNVSRVFTHELVRHRAGVAVSQESMRFVRLTDIPFWFPDWAKADEELLRRGCELLEELELFQEWLAERFGLDDDGVPFTEKKAKTSFMRRFAPDGVATGMLVTINVRALRHIVYMRTALAAEEEIRIVMDQVAERALSALPRLMQDYDRRENGEWVPEWLKV